MMSHRAMIGSVCAAVLATVACHDGLLHEPARAADASVVLAPTLSSSLLAGGPDEAYAQTNTLYVQFMAGEVTRLERTIPFNPNAGDVQVSFDVPLQDAAEEMWFWIELRRGNDVVFYGNNQITVTAGEVVEAGVDLQPHVWDVTCSGPRLDFDAYGQRAQLSGVPVFVTGDTIPGLLVTWGANSQAITVDGQGTVESVSDGDAEVYCFAGDGMGTRPVRVLAVVDSIVVTPPSVDVFVGNSVTLNATAYDRFQNVIPGRTLQWVSGNTAVATVSQTGVVTGVSAGQTVVTASYDGVTGVAGIIVLP